ncbi:MAG: hypothetical protein K0R59_1334 [Sphingobacterium sp.]|uniref:hypothetical protein n=1 Tax=unclassified Sphingobacterium TaxID=2609468 RepID=UPI000985A813|nr:hypothetical protein [Sphingobacterium sp. CZ-UAM]MDF2516038.1 hypothetical protein [Sphingobacterium sp.]OOG18755.1 hypothetical protein BWD42_01980 [Sphingobacterium sp. CZ-UAM]
MKTKLVSIIIISIFIASCKTRVTPKFMIDNDGILVEKFDSTDVDDNRYNRDNKIYVAGTKFIYSYKHIGNDKRAYLIGKISKSEKKTNEWEFIPIERKNDSTILNIAIIPLNGNAFKAFIPDYNQTNFLYNFLNIEGQSIGQEITGVIENKKNIWIHPPRFALFSILELNPFPYISFPIKTGKKWDWHLSIGDQWANVRWKKWIGRIENQYIYEILEHKKVKTKFGEIKCVVSRATANSQLGKTFLISYFNEKYGFIKLEYINIDGSQTIFELDKVIKN